MNGLVKHSNLPAGTGDPLDQALNAGAPNDVTPTTLHGAIMQAVKAGPVAAPMFPGRRPGLRLAAPLALALVVVSLWWVAHPRQPNSRASLTAAVEALQFTQEAAPESVAAAALRPLADEMGRLNQDLDNTAKFLLASIP